MSKPKCNRDCFNCTYSDCRVNDEVTEEERLASIERDNEVKASNAKNYRTRYYYANQEKCKRWSRENYHRHVESKREKSKKYYHSHKEKFREYDKRWKEEHKELLKERQHQYYLNWKRKKEQKNE